MGERNARRGPRRRQPTRLLRGTYSDMRKITSIGIDGGYEHPCLNAQTNEECWTLGQVVTWMAQYKQNCGNGSDQAWGEVGGGGSEALCSVQLSDYQGQACVLIGDDYDD